MAEFKKVLSKSDLAPGSAKTVSVDGRAIALYNVDGQVYATDNACPHRGGPLGEGDLSGKEITCPWHGWGIDVTTGCASHNPSQVKTYPVKVEGESVLVEI